MKVGDLFLDITLKGAETVTKGLAGVKNWFTDVSSSGIAAKAAILGAFYALEKMTAASAKFGNELTSFSLLTGIDTTKVQQWSEYMRRSGQTAEDATSSLLAAQKTATNIQMGQVPQGLAWISKATHTNLLEHLNDPLKFLDTVKQYIQTTKDATGLANEMALSVGVTPGAIEAFRKKVPGIQDVYGIKDNIGSAGQIKRLDQVYQGFSDLEKKLSRFRDFMTDKFGLQAIQVLNQLLDAIKSLIVSVDKATASFTDMRGLLQPALGAAPGGEIVDNSKESEISKKAKEFLYGIFGAPPSNNWHPPMRLPQTTKGEKHAQNNINIYQNGIEDTHESIDAMKRDVSLAWASISTRNTVA